MIHDFLRNLQEGLNVYIKLLCTKNRIFRTIYLFVEEFRANPNLYIKVKRKETKENKQQFIISPK